MRVIGELMTSHKKNISLYRNKKSTEEKAKWEQVVSDIIREGPQTQPQIYQ